MTEAESTKRTEGEFDGYFGDIANIPISFTYGGKNQKGFGGFALTGRTEKKDGAKRTLTFVMVHADGLLQATVTASVYPAYNAYEWTAYFKNIGSVNTPVLSEVVAADVKLWAPCPVVKGILGDHGNKYKPYEVSLDGLTFTSTLGRPTHHYFPYFNLESKAGGMIAAIGWAGTWYADFKMLVDGNVLYKAGGTVGFSAYLKSGETVRTPLAAFVRYYEPNEDAAMNAWRRWFIDCNMPKANAKGDPIEPMVVSVFAGDTGKPNSDGSISEGYDTWKRTADKIFSEKLSIDFRWIDAGWYYDSAGESLETDWGQTGTLTLDKNKWKGDSLRESTDYMRAHGAKTLMWFEPERVFSPKPELLTANYGFKQEWLISRSPEPNYETFANLGNPECFKWTRDKIIGIMDENGIDLYREDFNAYPAPAWTPADLKQGENRIGITENLYVQGHLKLWDEIIDYCRQNGKCTFVDSCASGGGRNDLESMRRGVPLMRSDADRTTIALRLSMTTSFNRWIPYTGASNGEKKTETEAPCGLDMYEARGSHLPVFHSHFQFNNPNMTFNVLREAQREWEKISPYFCKDFYVLTEWKTEYQTDGWTAWMYFDPQTESGILQVFRQEKSLSEKCYIALRGVSADNFYRLTDFDGKCSIARIGGDELLKGTAFTLTAPRSAAVFKIERQNETDGKNKR